MKITAQEEYGIRILLGIAKHKNPEGITIPQLSKLEGLSQHYVAKLCRLLRIGGFINSTRGKEGGYSLALPPSNIHLSKVLRTLGGKLYTPEFCKSHSGNLNNCRHSSNCSVRSVWQLVQKAVDQVLENYTLEDLIAMESNVSTMSLPA